MRVAVEGSAIAALGFKDDYWIIAFDGCDEQTLGVVWRRSVDDFEAWRMGELGLWALRMVVSSPDAASGRCSECDWAPEFAA